MYFHFMMHRDKLSYHCKIIQVHAQNCRELKKILQYKIIYRGAA